MLNYIENNLCNGEVVVRKARKSKILMLKSVLISAVLMAIGIGVNDGSVLMICMIAALLLLVSRWIGIRQYELVVTNRKIAAKAGIIRKKVQECPLERIDTVSIENNILGAIFGYGTVVVKAVNGNFKFSHIVRPADFKNDIMNAIGGVKEAEATLQAQRLAEAMRAAVAIG